MKPGDSGSTHICSHASPEYHQDPEKRNFGAENQVSSSLEAPNSLITVLRQAPNLRDRDNVDAEHLALEELAIYLADCDMNGGKRSPDARFALRDAFSALVRYRLMVREYIDAVPPQGVLRVLQCVRLFLRGPSFVAELIATDGAVKTLGQQYRQYASAYCEGLRETHGEHDTFQAEILSEVASIFKKLASVSGACPLQLLVDCDVHRSALSLISTRDAPILASVLTTLSAICSRVEECAALVVCPYSVYHVLLIMCEYDAPFNHLAGKLLQTICRTKEGKKELQRLGSVSMLMSLIRRPSDEAVLESSLRILGCILSDSLAINEFRDRGGVPILLALLIPRSTARTTNDLRFRQPAVTCLICSALTKIASDDVGSKQIQNFNGIYLLVKLLIDTHALPIDDRSSRPIFEIIVHALRALRFLFSMISNRKTFQHLFPPDIFGAFIDIGHYMQDIRLYRPLAREWLGTPASVLKFTFSSLEEINHGRGGNDLKPWRVVHGYAVDELLGTGAFASVYRVHKENDRLNTDFAMKELYVDRSFLDHSLEQVTASVGQVAMEIEILSKLEHPNIVKYYESFMENDRLYIIMELVEGQNLLDFVNSTADKKEVLLEGLIWEIFLQIVLALNYIHVDKGVVHRDLSPNNILLEHNMRRVKLADFGLAKVHESDCSKSRKKQENMQSAVGTMPFSCPEIIMHASYGEKADIWSLGCILYFMLASRPPFEGSNPLALASAIVEGRYEPLDAFRRGPQRQNSQSDECHRNVNRSTTLGFRTTQKTLPCGNNADTREYSPALIGLVGMLLVTDPDKRPSALEVAATCAPYLMRSLDNLQSAHDKLQRYYKRDKSDALMMSVGTTNLQKHEAISYLRSVSVMEREKHKRRPNNAARDDDMVSGDIAGDMTFKNILDEKSNQFAIRSNVTFDTPNDRIFRVTSDCFRPMTNPLSDILAMIHKIIFLDQLPPDLGRDPRQTAVHRFKRHLFAADQNVASIKSETSKLLARSKDIIKLNIATASKEAQGNPALEGRMQNVTYDSLGRSIEDLLVSHGFYGS